MQIRKSVINITLKVSTVFCEGTKIFAKIEQDILENWVEEIFGLSKWKEGFVIK